MSKKWYTFLKETQKKRAVALLVFQKDFYDMAYLPHEIMNHSPFCVRADAHSRGGKRKDPCACYIIIVFFSSLQVFEDFPFSKSFYILENTIFLLFLKDLIHNLKALIFEEYHFFLSMIQSICVSHTKTKTKQQQFK